MGGATPAEDIEGAFKVGDDLGTDDGAATEAMGVSEPAVVFEACVNAPWPFQGALPLAEGLASDPLRLPAEEAVWVPLDGTADLLALDAIAVGAVRGAMSNVAAVMAFLMPVACRLGPLPIAIGRAAAICLVADTAAPTGPGCRSAVLGGAFKAGIEALGFGPGAAEGLDPLDGGVSGCCPATFWAAAGFAAGVGLEAGGLGSGCKMTHEHTVRE